MFQSAILSQDLIPLPRDLPPVSGDGRSRQADLLLGVVLAVYPLLPSGPLYFGLKPANYSLIGFLMLATTWMVVRVREPGPPNSTRGLEPGYQLLWAWGAFVLIATGAAFVGMSAENDFSSPVFWAHLRELPADVVVPMHTLSEPMYSVSVWLVFLQGGLAFALVRDLCLRASNPRRRARVALYGWLTGYGIVALLAVFQYATQFQLHPYWVRVNPDLVRSHSTFEDPNMLGAYLVLGLGAVLGFMWFSRSEDVRGSRWPPALALLGVAALYTTVSRSAWLAFPFALTLFLAFAPHSWMPPFVSGRRYLKRTARLSLPGALVVVGAMVIARTLISTDPVRFQPTSPIQAALRTLDPRLGLTEIFSNRFEWWGTALRMFEKQPLVGVGLGRYPRLVQEYSSSSVPPENAHNTFLQVLGEAGGLGFAGMVLLVCAIFRSLTVSSRASRLDDAAVARGTLLGVTAFLMTCVSGHPLLLASGQVVLATMLATVIVLSGKLPHASIGSPAVAMPRVQSMTNEWKAAPSVVGGLALLWYPAAALGDMPRAWEEPSMWGYSWGLFPEEVAPGSGSYRWTGRGAIVDLEMPPAAAALELRVAAPSPVRGGRSTQASFRIGTRTASHTFDTAGPATVSLEIDPAEVGDDRRVRLVINVEPTLVPSALGGSDDSRQLGLQLFPPVWRDSVNDRRTDSG